MPLFGEILRKYRRNAKDTASGKQLSQERLGELIGFELGMSGGYSGAAISDWERGESKIQADERSVLVSIIMVLYKQSGLKTVAEADELLEAGNYRTLSLIEKRQIFPQTLINMQTNPPISQKYPKLLTFLQEQILNGILGEKVKARLAEVEEGPKPAWPRQVVVLVNEITNGWTIFQTLRILAWIWTWLLSFWLIPPSLRWPFISQEQALIAMMMYGAGILVLPVFIGALTTTKNNPFWQEYLQTKDWIIRFLYAYQGAGIGFYLGYMGIFAIRLIIYYLQYYLGPYPNLLIQRFIEAIEVTCLLIISYGCARLVPHNLWKAFKRLDLADGGVFFVFVVIGPIWGLAFYILYPLFLEPILGSITIVSALTLAVLAEARQYHLTGKTIVPAHWHVLLYGSIAVLYETTVRKNLFDIVALAGMIITFIALLAFDRIRYTLRGMIVACIILYFSICVLQWNLWIGLIILFIELLAWWRWGGRYLSFPRVFWGIVSILIGCFWMWQHQWLSDLQASIFFSVMTFLLLLRERKLHIIS